MGQVRFLLGLGVLITGSYACSSDNPSPPACNTLVDDGPTVTLMLSTAAAPLPAGGTVTDGTYVFTAATLYGSAQVPPTTFSAVMQISGMTMQQVGRVNAEEMRYTSTFTTSGSTVTTTDSCPAPSTGSHQFTATSTELRVYDAALQGVLEQTYTKR